MNQLHIATAVATTYDPGRTAPADFDIDAFDADAWDGAGDADSAFDEADWGGCVFDTIFNAVDRRTHADAARALFAAQ
jgi:hypothetical protein